MWVSYNLKLGKPVILCMNNPEIFTPEDEERKRELIELVASGEAVLIAGSGSSARVDYVTWDGLLKRLEDLADQYGCDFEKDEEKRVKKPLEYAEDIKSHIKQMTGDLREYHALLYQLFELRNFSPDQFQFHKTLVTLPFKGILTTNYDVVLEQAIKVTRQLSAYEKSFTINRNTAGQVHRFFLAMNNPDELPVAHLHGIYDDPTKIILSNEDYVEAYDRSAVVKETPRLINYLGSLIVPSFLRFSFFNSHIENQVQRSTEWTLHRKLLWSVLATRRVVFIGFGMKDPYFKKMLETVAKDLWRGNKPVHFAIRGVSSKKCEVSKAKKEAEKLKQDCGVETLFYKDTNGKHEGLVDIVNEIAEKCNIEIPSRVVSQDPSDDNNRSDDEQPKTDDVDWLEQVNQRMETGD